MMYINRNITAIITILMVVILSGCVNNASQQELLNGIKAINKQCPIPNESGTLNNMGVEDEYIIFNFTINKTAGDISKLNGHEALLSELFAQNLVSNRVLHQDEFTNLVITSGYGLRVNYHDADNKAKIQFTLSNADIKSTKQHPADAERIMELSIAVTKLQLPFAIDESTTMVDLDLSSDYLCYLYLVDDEQVDIDLLRDASDEIRIEMENVLKQNENSPLGFYTKITRQTGRGISIIYRGAKSQKDVIINFSNEELRTIIGDYVINE